MASESIEESGAPERVTHRSARKMRTWAERRAIAEASFDPQTSIARIAREHGVNANQVFHWRKLYRQGLLDHNPKEAAMIPVRLQKTSSPPSRIEIESPKSLLNSLLVYGNSSLSLPSYCFPT